MQQCAVVCAAVCDDSTAVCGSASGSASGSVRAAVRQCVTVSSACGSVWQCGIVRQRGGQCGGVAVHAAMCGSAGRWHQCAAVQHCAQQFVIVRVAVVCMFVFNNNIGFNLFLKDELEESR